MTPPSTIAHYRIVAKLGEGGMGAVYRATDTKLNRDVAIKVLPAAFAEDTTRMQRFEREAQVLASLNHPNIAAIYGIEAGAIVMELVEGDDLKGPVPVGTAIGYARQIAAALEAAHDKGIIHRDLKPANIKVTPDGTVKLLDFGLAKAADASPASSSATLSPTLSLAMTQAGMILGTAAYMAPEQARGKAVDRRADIWAFGVVLFEMLTGRQLFSGGDTVTDIIAAVVTREPDWKLLPATSPTHLRRLLERCLCKDPKQRLQAIGEARIALDEPVPPVSAAPVQSLPPRRSPLRWAIPLGLALAGAAWWTGAQFARTAPAPMVRLTVDLGPQSVAAARFAAVLSPDGSRVLFTIRRAAGVEQLAIRVLSQDKITPLPGTESGTDPFFSPDGQWIGFFANGRLKKVPVTGGAPAMVADSPNARGAAWGEDGSIVFTPGTTTGLVLVRDTGGTVEVLTDPTASKQGTHRWPQFLPGSRYILFTGHTTPTNFDDAGIEVFDRQTRQIKTVVKDGFFGRYVSSGHLLYVRRDTLYAVRFDPSRLETSGTPVAILQDVSSSVRGGSGEFDVSAAPAGAGTFVYLSGSQHDLPNPMLWLDAGGHPSPLLPTPGFYAWPRLSNDGRLLAVSPGGADIQVWDAERGKLTQLTYNGQLNRFPILAPDGKHLVYSSHTNTLHTFWWLRTDGAGQPVKLLEKSEEMIPTSIAPDGRHLAFYETGPGTGGDLWTLPLDLSDPEQPQAGKPEVFLQTPKVEMAGVFSPDGRWLAYSSDDTGPNEIYVRPFPGPGGVWKVSGAGGQIPRWASASHRLFYATNDSHMMVLDYEIHGDTFVAGKPTPFAPNRTLIYSGYDVSPDGQRVAAEVSEEAAVQASSLQVTFLLNFFDELKRRVP